MLKSLKDLFEQQLVAVKTAPPAAEDPGIEHAYRLAVATLLVEMMRADFEEHADEHQTLTDTLSAAFGLSTEETDQLVRRAHEEADQAVSLHDFTSLINQYLAPEQKYHVIELLWRVAYADGKIDKYEDHLVRKVADLIYVPHREFIRAKLSVQAG